MSACSVPKRARLRVPHCMHKQDFERHTTEYLSWATHCQNPCNCVNHEPHTEKVMSYQILSLNTQQINSNYISGSWVVQGIVNYQQLRLRYNMISEGTRRKTAKSRDASSASLLDEQSERRARRAREPVADTRGAALPRAAITSQKGNSLFLLQIPTNEHG